MKSIKEAYEEGWKALVEAPKYSYTEDFLGPPVFIAGAGYVHRKDFTIKNEDKLDLKCCIYIPQALLGQKNISCVLFLHTHGGSRMEGMFLKQYLLPKVAFCLFDFAGCGLSEGVYVTLGVKEMRDTRQVIAHIKKNYNIGNLYLWGRSMGAVTAILLASKHPDDICGMVLDSPFNDVNVMVKDFVTSSFPVPRCLIGCLLCCLAKTIKKQVGVNILKVRPISSIKTIRIPCFFLVAKDDVLSRASRVKDLFESCGSPDKSFFLIDGQHATERDSLIVRKAVTFIFKRHALEMYREEINKQYSFETLNGEEAKYETKYERKDSEDHNILFSEKDHTATLKPVFVTKEPLEIADASIRHNESHRDEENPNHTPHFEPQKQQSPTKADTSEILMLKDRSSSGEYSQRLKTSASKQNTASKIQNPNTSGFEI